mgnify:FL=1
MPHFIFAYHGGKTPETPEETEAEIGRWQSWFDSIGDAIIDPGNPVGMSKTGSATGVSDDGGANPLSGYTIIQTDSIDRAVELAKACPIMIEGGSIEVAEIHEVTM